MIRYGGADFDSTIPRPALPAQDASGAPNGPVGSHGAPEAEIALQRPERTHPMTARGTVTVTADTLEDARRQTAEAIRALVDRWTATEREPHRTPTGAWTVTTTWTEGAA